MSCRTVINDLGPHICLKLINLVKQHPIIYVSSKEASVRSRTKRNEINQIWDNIAFDIGLPVDDCKRRWRTLKDVYAKICKRRLQEGVLGIKARKKWLYEQNMSFMKFLFDQPYQEALENVEEVYSKEMENSDATEESQLETNLASDTEEQEESENGTIEYLDLDPVADSYSEDKTPPEVMKDSIHSLEAKARSRFRAIRPKPYQPNFSSKNRAAKNGNVKTPVVNVFGQNPRRQIIVASPALGSVNKIEGPKAGGKETQSQIDSKKSSGISVELFFKSMASSVMKLPTAVQAEIKMNICKIVTRAEIQHSSSLSRKSSRSKNR